MIRVRQIAVSVNDMEKIPQQERSLMLIVGYISNQVSMMQKLLIMAANNQPVELVEQYAAGSQTQMLLRLKIGVLNEAYEKIRELYLSTSIGKEYRSYIDDPGAAALERLKKAFGNSGKIPQIRNRFGFHLPSNFDMDIAYNKAKMDSELCNNFDIYLSEHGFNSLFLISDIIFSQGIVDICGAPDWVAAYSKLLPEITSVSNDIIEFSHAYFVAVWRRYIGSEILAKRVMEVHSITHIDEVSIPYFVEVS